MDVNGTHFQLLLGMNDWGNCTIDTEDGSTIPLSQLWKQATPCAATGSAWDDASSELTLQPCLLQTLGPLSHTPPQLSDRRGAGRDRYGNWYWIDKSGGELLVNSVGTGNTTHFWSLVDGIARSFQANGSPFQPRPGEEQSLPDPLSLSGLTVTADHYLVVGVLQPAGLLVFDLFSGGPPQLIVWPPAVPFVPFDMAAMPGAGVWILDRDNARYWAIDGHFNVITQEQQELLLAAERVELFQPTDGSSERRAAARTFPGGISLQASIPVALSNPVAIEALPDGTVLLLDSNPQESFSLIYRYFFSRQLGKPVSTEIMKMLVEEGKQDSFHLRGHDFAFVPEHSEDSTTLPDRLYVVPQEGNQVYAFTIWQQDNQLGLQPLPNYFPMRMFGGKALVSVGGQAWYDFADGWVPLVEQRRSRYANSVTFYTALTNPPYAFDGRLPDCVWHRLMLDGCIPPETTVLISSRAANAQEELSAAQWQQEPPLYLRSDGSELPFVEPVTGEDNGTWELLFQAARGRYLQLKIVLSGNGRSTPRLRAMRIYYPRFSYLEHYLPAVYRQDSQSASFLDRFLANLEGFYTSIEDKIAAAQMLFDARSAPAETLDWLASWYGIALDLTWDTNRRRLFLRHAMDFFQYRGTICGLLMMLRVTFDSCPDETIFTNCSQNNGSSIRIVEAYQTRRSAPRPNWSPAQGGDALQQDYLAFLQQRGLDTTHVSSFPLVAPTDASMSAAWKEFSQDELGFIPSLSNADQNRWWNFLQRRYEKIDALNSVYQSNFTDFVDIKLPQAGLPSDGPALQDWYQFQSTVLGMSKNAHQFTVLLPAPTSGSVADYQHGLDLATRIIEMEKPAHTIFSVKFYLAAFRIGVTRLGVDTVVDLGSRTPQLMAPMILGQGYLLESYLASEQLLDATHRAILKREQQT